jgi:hypothetical protein
MPEHADSLALAVAVDRPNIFAAPTAHADDTAADAVRADGGSVFTSAPTAAQPDRRAGPFCRARSDRRVVRLPATGISLRICVSLAGVVAAAVALLVLHELGDGASARRALITARAHVGSGSVARPHAPARLRSARGLKSEGRTHPHAHRRASSRAGRSPSHSRCCRRRSSRRGALSAAPIRSGPAIRLAPTPAATSPQPAAPAGSPDHGTPAPVPVGAPPEFM